MSTAAPAPGQRRLTDQGRERKQQLLDAAAELFAARGYGPTRIADICEAAGVAKGLFYWYFDTKESLFAELVRSMRLQLRRAQAAAMADEPDPVTRIRRGCEASVRFMAEHRAYFALLDLERIEGTAGDTLAPVLQEGAEVYAADVERLVREAQASGRLPDGDAHLMAVGVVGTVAAFGQALRTGRIDTTVDELAGYVGEWIARALG